jgi:elongation factor Ts
MTLTRTQTELATGVIVADTHRDRIGALVEVRCDTDFAARTDEFRALCRELVLQAIGGPGEGPLEEQDYIRDPSRKVASLIEECARQIGERIQGARYVRWTV